MKKLKIFGLLLFLVLAACENQRGLRQAYSSARECLAAGDSLLQQDSVVQGETLLRQAVGTFWVASRSLPCCGGKGIP